MGMKNRLLLMVATAVGLGNLMGCSRDDGRAVSDDELNKPIAFSVNVGEVAEPQVGMRGAIQKGTAGGTISAALTAMRGASAGSTHNGGYTFVGGEVMYVSLKGTGTPRPTTPQVAKYTVGASTPHSLTYAGTGTAPYWLTSSETITLHAWADGTTSTTATDPNGQTFAIETTQSGTHVKELLYAAPKNYGYSTYSSGLNIPLYHQTARLVVNVLSDDNTITVTGVQIGSSTNKVPTSGIFTAPTTGNTTGTWSSQGSAGVITAKAETTASVTDCIATYSAVVIPYNGTQATPAYYKQDDELVTITTSGGDTYVYTLGSGVNIEAGKHYTLNLTLQAGGGTFNSGDFTVAAGTTVKFSQGNLRATWATWNGSKWTWAFADNQWDYIGNAAGNTSVNGNGTVNTNNVTVDLFGWVGKSNTTWSGTNGSGSTGEAAMHGITNSTTVNNASHYGSKTGNQGETLKSDWGKVTITNGGGYTWRSLTSAEWTYLFNTRTTGGTVFGTKPARYAHATINTDGTSVNGMILFPDGVNIASSEVTTAGTVNRNSEFATKCTTAQWGKLAAKGCVFLPAADYRNGTTVSNAGSLGRYWSSTAHPSSAYDAYSVAFGSGYLGPASSSNRGRGFSVRLVRVP